MNKTCTKHTPAPWKLSADKWSIIGANGQNCDANQEANTEYMLRAVNSHEALLEIVKNLRHRSFDPSFKGWDFEELDKVIEQADGEQQ